MPLGSLGVIHQILICQFKSDSTALINTDTEIPGGGGSCGGGGGGGGDGERERSGNNTYL